MIRALAAYKTPNRDEVPEILYLGNDGAKLQSIASKQGGKGFVRMRWFQLDGGIPVAVPQAKVEAKPASESDDQARKDAEKAAADAEKAAKKAEAKARKDAEKAAKNKPE